MVLLTVTDQKPDTEIRSLIAATVQSAEQEFAPLKFEGECVSNGIGLGVLRPRHVIANDFWQMTVTTSFANWINKTFGNNNYAVFTGVFNLTIDPATSEIWPSANGKDLPYMNIENLYAMRDQRGFFSKPYAVGPNNNITIQAIGRVAQTERLGLLGYVVGKRSYLITASP